MNSRAKVYRAVSPSRSARLTDAAPENFCRPAVDVLFRSLARTVGNGVLGLVLTGMGSDGTAGAVDLAAAGATLWAQDEASSVVWGMPGAVVGAGLAHKVLPLNQLAREIIGIAARGRSNALIGAAR